jgi:hypothetical protein
MLQEAAATRLDDYSEFLVGEAREDLGGAPEGGSRYPIQAQMDCGTIRVLTDYLLTSDRQ